MKDAKWKVCIVATETNQRYIEGCIESLANGGYREDGIHVVCGQGVAVPNIDFVAKRRDPVKLSESAAWVSALTAISGTYAATDDIFLFLSPEIRVWPKLRIFASYTMEMEFVAVYLPYTPVRYYVDSDHRRPPCHSEEAAWCEFRLEEPSASCQAILVNRHTARLLSGYLADILSRDITASWGWPDLFYYCVSQLYRVICYSAVPSFAKTAQKTPVEYVGDFNQSGVRIQTSRYLN